MLWSWSRNAASGRGAPGRPPGDRPAAAGSGPEPTRDARAVLRAQQLLTWVILAECFVQVVNIRTVLARHGPVAEVAREVAVTGHPPVDRRDLGLRPSRQRRLHCLSQGSASVQRASFPEPEKRPPTTRRGPSMG